MRVLVCLIFAIFFAFSAEYKIASYNVQNLFDGVENGSEYSDFKGNKWNQKKYDAKLQDISKIIKNIDADVIGVQEIENYGVLKELANQSGYEYFAFATLDKKSPVGLGIMSKFAIKNTDKFTIPGVKTRPILKAQIMLGDEVVSFFVAHFPASKNSLSKRKSAAKTMIRVVNNAKNAVILGDLNSNFGDDFLLNDLQVVGFKNLWSEINKSKRKSHKNGGSLDHIMLSKDFFVDGGLHYKSESFGVFNPFYIKTSSDHYPIFATLTSQKQEFSSNLVQDSDISQVRQRTIDQIYKPSTQKAKISAIVCFDDKNGFAICDEEGRGIYVFSPKNKPKIGDKILILVKETKIYKGNLEIFDFDILKSEKSKENIAKFGLKDLSIARSGDVAFDLNLDIKNGFAQIGDQKYKIFSQTKKITNGKITAKSAMFWSYDDKKEIIIK